MIFVQLTYGFVVSTGAGIELITKAGGKVVECGCVIELPELKGREKLGGVPLFILVEKEDTEGGLA
jgi:adenine/guanine phosphoribosyltransferase-like PRPP-binding protein